MGDNADVKYDPDGMREMAKDLEEVADSLDGADQSIPVQVDAGIFAPHVADQINESVANVADLILRLRAAADLVRATAEEREAIERQNEREAERIGKGRLGVYPQ